MHHCVMDGCLVIFQILYLIKKDEIDIYDIPVERITSQYMDYLNMMKMLDLNMAGEFIVMAATLMVPEGAEITGGHECLFTFHTGLFCIFLC